MTKYQMIAVSPINAPLHKRALCYCDRGSGQWKFATPSDDRWTESWNSKVPEWATVMNEWLTETDNLEMLAYVTDYTLEAIEEELAEVGNSPWGVRHIHNDGGWIIRVKPPLDEVERQSGGEQAHAQ